MVGATPQLATAVWVGTADNTSAIFDQYGGIMYGAGAPTKIWKSVLDNSLANSEFQNFPAAYPLGFGNMGAGTAAPAYDPSWDSGAGDTQYYEPPAEQAAPEEETKPVQPENKPESPKPAPKPQHGNGNSGNSGNSGNNNRAPAQPEVPSLDDLIGPDGDLAGLLG